jgi:hypothetical protein
MKTRLLALSLFLFVSIGAATRIHAQDTKPKHHHIDADSLQNAYQADIEKQVEDALLVAKTQLDKANVALAMERDAMKRQIDLTMKEALKAYDMDKMQKDVQSKALEEVKLQLRLNQEVLRKSEEQAQKAMKDINMDSIQLSVKQAMDSVTKAIGSMGAQ